MEQVKVNRPVIVAMKGRPYTGKSTLALAIAQALRCPLIDYDDVRASTATIHQLLSASTTTIDASNLLDKLSYDAIFRIASKQLSLHLPLSLVIDSPLSDETHLNRLKRLASSSSTLLYVVDCKPQDESEWRHRLEELSTNEPDEETRWYKPTTWEDVQLVVPDYYDDGQQYDVPRIVIDTTSTVEIEVHVVAVLNLIAGTEEEDDDHVSITVEKGKRELKILLDDHPHSFNFSDDLREEEKDNLCLCSYSKQSISGPNYRCTECSYILHKPCAESALEIQVPVHQHPLSLLRSRPFNFCGICGERFSLGYSLYQCETCNLKLHRQCGLLPTNLNHGLHQHPLDFNMNIPFNFPYRCLICADRSISASYNCSECLFYLHPWCAFLPLTAKHDRHLHGLRLDLAPKDDSDEYYCNACEELRNPDQHVYYCADCEFAAHLSCLIPPEFLRPPVKAQHDFPGEAY